MSLLNPTKAPSGENTPALRLIKNSVNYCMFVVLKIEAQTGSDGSTCCLRFESLSNKKEKIQK